MSLEEIEQRLRAHVQRLAGEIGERNVYRPECLQAAARYVEEEWRRQGYDVSAQRYDAFGTSCANLEATRRGTRQPDAILLLGAHYDTVRGSPGADDNASGVAGLLELSRLFAAERPAMSVRFVAFVNEEPPFFMGVQQGSVVYAQAARARGDDIRLMVSLEMLGYYQDEKGSQRYPPLFRCLYPGRGNFLGFVSDLRSRRTMRLAARAFRQHSAFPLEQGAFPRVVPGVTWSDHAAFWAVGYRAFMATDTAFYRNPNYHTARDTPDTLAYPAFARAVEGLFRCFAALAASGMAAR